MIRVQSEGWKCSLNFPLIEQYSGPPESPLQPLSPLSPFVWNSFQKVAFQVYVELGAHYIISQNFFVSRSFETLVI